MEKSQIIINNENVNQYLGLSKLLQIYSKQRDNDSFLLGYLVAEIPSYFIFEAVDEYGALDGYTLFAKSDMADVVTNTKYTNIYENYVEQQKNKNSYDTFGLKEVYDNMPKNSLLGILDFCYQQQKIIMLSTSSYDSSRGGRVIDLSNDYIILDQVDYYNDWDNTDMVIDHNDQIKINEIIALDIISKDNYLYEQYLLAN